MRKSIMVVILWMCLPTILFAQEFWETLNTPDTARIHCIEVTSQDNIFIGTGYNNMYGGIYRSCDYGVLWECVFDAGFHGVLNISSDDQEMLYMSKTGFDNFYISSDNGNSWIQKIIPTQYNGWISEILACDNGVVYLGVVNNENIPFLIKGYSYGDIWDSIASFPEYSSSKITSISVYENNTLIIGIDGFTEESGGVMVSENGGLEWEFIGLENQMIEKVIFNSAGDIYACSWGTLIPEISSGLFVKRQNSDNWEQLIYGTQVSDIIIYDSLMFCSCASPNGIALSSNGHNFEIIENSNPGFGLKDLDVDHNGYLYVSSAYASNYIGRSINSIVVNIDLITQSNFIVYPNPVSSMEPIIKLKGETPLEYKLYDINGTILKTGNLSGLEVSIDISEFKSRVFFLELSSLKETKIIKIIKT